MRQHNCWKIKQILNFFMKVILWIFGVSLLILKLIFKEILNFDMISTIISVITIVVAFLWRQFEKSWWKKDWIQSHLPDEFKTPIVEGRWSGTLERDGTLHEFIIEIRQTFTSVSCSTYSKHSFSSSIFAEILYNHSSEIYQLIYFWNGKTENTGDETLTSVNFDGCTILFINTSHDEMSGEYFTNRQPKQTMGKLYFNRRQEMLKNSFE